MKLRVLVAETTDPYFNLATEDWIFNDMSPQSKVLFLWRNDKSIIIGRGQNAWSECDLEKVEADGVKVVRRHSGGGAVYQDLGNTCFTFMSGREKGRTTKELYARNNQILIAALKTLNVVAEASGRNDLVVEVNEQPYKISGSAFKESKDRCFHHGTMLMSVDLGRLGTYLTPDEKKLEAKGIKSVKSRVLNLTEISPNIDHPKFVDALVNAFFEFYQARCDIEYLDNDALQTIDSLQAYYQKLKSWDWIFGKTPHFKNRLKERFSWGGVELFLDTEKGRIKQVQFFTDSLQADLVERVPECLTGVTYTKEGIAQAHDSHLAFENVEPSMLSELYNWIGAAL